MSFFVMENISSDIWSHSFSKLVFWADVKHMLHVLNKMVLKWALKMLYGRILGIYKVTPF